MPVQESETRSERSRHVTSIGGSQKNTTNSFYIIVGDCNIHELFTTRKEERTNPCFDNDTNLRKDQVTETFTVFLQIPIKKSLDQCMFTLFVPDVHFVCDIRTPSWTLPEPRRHIFRPERVFTGEILTLGRLCTSLREILFGPGRNVYFEDLRDRNRQGPCPS